MGSIICQAREQGEAAANVAQNIGRVGAHRRSGAGGETVASVRPQKVGRVLCSFGRGSGAGGGGGDIELAGGGPDSRGRQVLVDPIKPALKPPGIERLKL